MAEKKSNPWAVSVRVKHYNTDKTRFQIGHDFRIGDQPKYVDGERSHLNSGTTKMGAIEYRDLMLERRKLTEPKGSPLMKRAAIMTGGIITFGHLAQIEIEALDTETQDRMYAEIADCVAEVLGNEVTGLASHRDEDAPHAHFQMPSRRAKDGRLMSEVLAPKITSQLQDEAARIAQRYAAKIQRGEKKENTGARNKSVKELHRTEAADLEAKQKDVENLKREISDLTKETDSARERRETNLRRALSSREKARTNTAKAEKHLKNAERYEKRAEDAQKAAEGLTERLEDLRSDEARLTASVERLEAREGALKTSVIRKEDELETVSSAVAQKKTKIDSWESTKSSLKAKLQTLNAA